MLALVIGGAGSGKSEYAEKLAVQSRKKNGRLLYCATMHRSASDAEGEARIRRHRELRQGKGFLTIEQEMHLEDMRIEAKDTLLLEDLTNLLANETYLKGGALFKETGSNEECAESGSSREISESSRGESEDSLREQTLESAILHPLLKLSEAGANVIVVANDVFRDGRVYDPDTMLFLRRLALLHRCIAGKADQVTEVVYGIPVEIRR